MVSALAVATHTRSLTERSATELAAAIRAREVTAREALEAHIELLERAKLNAIVAERFDAAREEADTADARLDAGEPDPPPLLGVPCTIKESIAVAGMPQTSGLVSLKGRVAEETAPCAQRLLGAGPVLLGVTNLSELTMWIESENRLYGRTDNAYDPTRTAGGSSGGEGAAVGSGGSPIGIGSDFAGSIRVPAFFNGVFGHRSSSGLVPATGMFPMSEGEAMRMNSVGPLARRAEDLMPVLRLIAGPDGTDPLTREVELGDPAEVEIGGLDVVLGTGTSYLPVRKELRDARERAAEALERRGARVQRRPMKSIRRATELFLAAAQSGAGLKLSELIVQHGSDPVTLRSALRRGGPHTRAMRLTLLTERIGLPPRRVKRALAAAESLQQEVSDIIGDGVLLHPPHPRVAPRHGRTVGKPWVLAPTAVFNLLGLPATQVPLGLNLRGLPLGVQVAGRLDNDHVTIAVAMALEEDVGGWVPPPRLAG
jgi:Asp-tRNA(Asn)/Glu-tRNA(Gln) amidotransferase A subunit family amidase